MDAGEKVSGSLIVAGGDCSELLEPADEILDEMAGFVQVFVEIALGLAVALGRDHGGLAGRQERFDYALIGIECFVGQHGIGFHLREKRVGTFEIMRLARGQEDASGLPDASTMRWIFVLNPPLLRPIAWFSPSFFGRRRCAGGRARSCCRS